VTGRRAVLGRVQAWLVDVAFAAGWALVKALPQRVAAAAFGAFAGWAARRQGTGVRRLRANLRRVVGPDLPAAELDALTRRAVRSYARYWLEVFRLPVLGSAVAVAADAGTVGTEHLDAAVAAGRGVILALPHSGNWDVAAVWLVRRTGSFTTVAERLRPESLYRRFVAYREGLGMEVVPLSGGDRSPSDVLTERLRAGGVVCLLGDRDLTRNGIEVTFFGERTKMPAGPVLLAATTGAALLPVGLWFDGDGWGQRIHPPLAIPATGPLRDRVRAGVQALADAFAADIAEHPADWHMLQRLWLADLDPSRQPAEPARPGPAPAAAAQPAEPAQPAQPAEPARPGPAAAAQPAEPARPAEPAQPAEA
jgi:KDO2-lipid IV(A) lauroyltransferase